PYGSSSDETRAYALSMVTMGTYQDVADALSLFNTAPDGDPLTPGVLYGPGFTAELPPVGPDDPIAQVNVTITENDSAGPVLMRVCRRLNWRLVDPDTGRAFG
ncbi:MAG: hypothetical protein J0L61_11245, partial [Planctomycetes bacterium]|nr:hypothetical protein [Planctomycetota bacterium]